MDLLEPRFVLGERCPGADSLGGSFLQASSASERSVLCQRLGVGELAWQDYLLSHLFPRSVGLGFVFEFSLYGDRPGSCCS